MIDKARIDFLIAAVRGGDFDDGICDDLLVVLREVALKLELAEQDMCRGWTYSSLTNAYLGIPEGIGPSARTSMTQPLPPSEEISDG